MLCIAETLPDNRIIDSVYSPEGISSNGHACVALLTASRNVGVFAPTKNPDRDSWKLMHAISTKASSDGHHDVDRARISSMTWTPALRDKHSSHLWGTSFLICGNDAGELTFFEVTSTTQEIVHTIKCSDQPVKKIKAGSWKDSQIRLIVCDSIGSVYLIDCHTEKQQDKIVPSSATTSTLLVQGKGARCSNLAIIESKGICTVAAAYPGRLAIVFNAGTSPVSQTYFLPFAAPITGLAWNSEIVEAYLILVVLGQYGQSIALQCDPIQQTINVDEATSSKLTTFAQEEVRGFSQTAPQNESHHIQFFGLAISPNGLLAAISYAFAPINRIRYLILAVESSRVSTLVLSSRPDQLFRSLTSFLQDPFATSIAEVLALHRRLDVPVLATLEQCSIEATSTMQSLSAKLFLNPDLNATRLKLIASEPGPETQALIDRLRATFFQEVLSQSLKTESITDPLTASMLLRQSDFLLLTNRDDEAITKIVESVYRALNSSGYPAGDETLLLNPSTPSHAFPPRDVCPACRGVIHIEDAEKGTCVNKHTWQRCALTLGILHDSRTCLECGRKSAPLVDDGSFYARVVRSVCVCYWCTGKLYEL